MRLAAYISIVMLFGSCATLFNSKLTRVTVHSSSPATMVFGSDTVKGLRTQWDIDTKRCKESLRLTLFKDSTSRNIVVRSRNSFAFWLNAYPGPTWIWGFVVDQKKNKRYAYPHNIFVNLEDSTKRFRPFANERKKGDVLLHISMPYINHFYSQPINEPTLARGGFFGISGGLDLYYTNKRYISFIGGAVIDNDLPFPVGFEYFGEYTITHAWSNFISVNNNYENSRFRMGYGLSFSENFWTRSHSSIDSLIPSTFVKRSTKSIGLTFSVYYKIGRKFNLGLIYKPSLCNISDRRRFVYEHLVSLDLAWKIHLHKGILRRIKENFE
jgi:hypothetical protein